MPLALLVAPTDPRAGDAGSRRDALSWLRGQLARYKFDVVIVGAGQNPHAAVEKAAPTINAGDSVLVHVSGRLVGRDALGFTGDRSLPLRLLTEVFASREPADLAFMAELTYEDDPADPSVPHAVLASAVQAFGAQTYGYPILAAVRRHTEPAGRIDFTKAVLGPPVAALPTPLSLGVLVTMHHRAMSQAETRVAADGFLFLRGRPSGDAEASAEWTPASSGFADTPLPPPPLPMAIASTVTEPSPPRIPSSLVPPEAIPPAASLAPPPVPSFAAPPAEPLPTSPLPPPVPASSAEPSWEDVDEPEHEPNALDAQIADATNAGDWTRAAELRLDRLASIEAPREKVRELIAVARILQAELGDSEGALAALEQAREIEPLRASTLRALRRGYEARGRWASAIEVLGTLASVAELPEERASYRLAQARVSLDRLDDPSSAMASLRATLEEDPTHGEALALLARLRSSTSEMPTATERTPGRSDAIAPPSPGSGDHGLSAGTERHSLDDVEASMLATPLDAAPYVRAFEVHLGDGSMDAAFLAAMAIEELEAAGPEHRAILNAARSVGPVRARAPLDAAAWSLLRAPGFDDHLAALFTAIEPAAIAVKLGELRESGRLPELDREQRLSETSTASIVRSFQWAARFLGLRCPDLYAMDDAPGLAVMHASEPSAALGKSVLSGRSAKDLAFLAGRHLTYYRPEHHVLLYYPTREALTELLLAAVQLAVPTSGSVTAPARVLALRARLQPHVGDRYRAALAHAVRALDARGGQAQIGGWMRSVELTAARAGLFLCGDLATAMALLRGEGREVAGLSFDERRGDLAVFCASRGHAAVRSRFVAMGTAETIPPVSGGQRLVAS